MKKINLIVILALFLFLAGGLAEGFEGYEWMPEGGCQILTSLNRSDLLTLATTNKTEEEWEKFKEEGFVYHLPKPVGAKDPGSDAN